MKRKRILTQFLLYFLMLMFLIVAGCSSGGSDDDDDDQNQQGPTVSISGTVTDAAGNPISGVVMSIGISFEVANITLWEGAIQSTLASPIITNDTGSFSFPFPIALLDKYTVVLTPAKKGYTFSPSDRRIPVQTTNITGQNFTATAVSAFIQRELAGIWRMNLLRAGADARWVRARLHIDADGKATCLSMYDSDDPTTNICPATPTDFDLTLEMDGEGVIKQYGASAVFDNGYMTMNSRKNFAAGTGTNGDGSPQLMIVQKDTAVDGAQTSHYIPADVQNKGFVFHSLSVGTANAWRYGNGATDATGLITMIAEEDPAGDALATSVLNGSTITLGVDGVVTIADAVGAVPGFEGFMSVDERTIVGTFTDAAGAQQLIVIQIGSGSDELTGMSYNNLMAANDTEAFWARHEINVSRLDTSIVPDIKGLYFYLDIMLSYEWNFSPALGYTQLQRLAYMNIQKLNINNIGEVTFTNNTANARGNVFFHGQTSNDGTFMVGVSTFNVLDAEAGDYYALNVITH